MNMMKIDYESPRLVVFSMNHQGILCLSVETENHDADNEIFDEQFTEFKW